MTKREFEVITSLLEQILEAVKPKVQEPFRIAPDGPPREACKHEWSSNGGCTGGDQYMCHKCGKMLPEGRVLNY